MTKEAILRTLKSILAEINESENAVCYLTSEDSETIESAIKALEQEPCEDAISRNIAVANVQELAKLHPNAQNNLNRVIKCLETLPPVQPKTGHWIDCEVLQEVKCSECRKCFRNKSNYCPNCGSKNE